MHLPRATSWFLLTYERECYCFRHDRVSSVIFFSSCDAVLGDANFPSASICKEGPELIRADGEWSLSPSLSLTHLPNSAVCSCA